MRRATARRESRQQPAGISIHALLAESDVNSICLIKHISGFLSTLSLRRATDKPNKLAGQKLVFLSTLSLRRATHILDAISGATRHFYPRSPCGERPQGANSRTEQQAQHDFYPRSPCGERRTCPLSPKVFTNFYPRSPCGERPPIADNAEGALTFLSTLSLRRATIRSVSCLRIFRDFYPRSPCGERLRAWACPCPHGEISIHALLAESDDDTMSMLNHKWISIHALLAESDSKPRRLKSRRCVFLSTLSLRRATVVHTLKLADPVLFLSTLSLRRATL